MKRKSLSQNDSSNRKRQKLDTSSQIDDSEEEVQEEEEEEEFDGEEIEFNRDDDARTGYILSVSLENFMCHKNLKVSFGPNINFLTGPNGSNSFSTHQQNFSNI